MKKWLETLALITLVIILRLLVNFSSQRFPIGGDFY